MDFLDVIVEALLTTAPQGLVTTAFGAIALLVYRRVSTFQPRHMVLERLRNEYVGRDRNNRQY